MKDELRAMKKSHLAIGHSLDVILDLFSEIDEGTCLEAEQRTALRAHTRLLKRLVAQHLDHSQATAESTGAWLDGTPEDVETLRRNIDRMDQKLQDFSASVGRLDDGIALTDVAWRHMRARLVGLVDIFHQCTDREWKFYSVYSTILDPGGISS